MNFNNFYDKVEDQFTPEALKKILNCYNDHLNIYNAIVYTNGVKNPQGFTMEQYNNFHMTLFNRWKNNLLNPNNKHTYIYNGENVEYLKKLIHKFSQMPSYNNPKELSSAKKSMLEGETEEFKEFYYKQEKYTGFPFIDSKVINRNYISKHDIKHRLYININSISDSEKIISYLMDRCEKDEVPYEIKFWCIEGRSDQLVIYSSNENLLKYIKYLEDFKEKYPEIVSNTHTPSILNGIYDGWIGYGTEPEKKQKKKKSFNSFRADIIDEQIQKAIKSYIDRNDSSKLRKQIIDGLVEDISNNKIKNKNNSLNIRKLRTILKRKVKELFNEKKYGEWFSIKVPLKKGGNKELLVAELENTIINIAKDDEKFINDLYISIKEAMKNSGINEKSCFDSYILDEMNKYDHKQKLTNEKKHDKKLITEFVELLKKLKDPAYDRKTRNEFVDKAVKIIDIYRNQIKNNEFSDKLDAALKNANSIYEEKQIKESKPKHFKKAPIIEKIKKDDTKQIIEDELDEKIKNINKRVDNGETLDSKIDELEKYKKELNNTRKQINEKFKEIWNDNNTEEFNSLLEKDNKIKNMISQTENEIEKRKRIKNIVDLQIKSEEITTKIEEFEKDVRTINNSSLTDEHKKLLLDQLYKNFDDYAERNPEESGYVR